MRNPHGYAYARDRYSGKEEGADTITCNHCNGIHEVPAGKTPPAWCSSCSSYLCDKPACSVGCVPFIKQVEEQERRYHARRTFMKAAGID